MFLRLATSSNRADDIKYLSLSLAIRLESVLTKSPGPVLVCVEEVDGLCNCKVGRDDEGLEDDSRG